MKTNPFRSRCLAAIISALLMPFAMAAESDEQTAKIVEATNTFIATLTETQKDLALYEFSDDTQRTNWSNFPEVGAGVHRGGVRWGDLSDVQRTALTELLGIVLSPDGLEMAQQQMAADDIVKATDTGPTAGNRPPGGPPSDGQRPGGGRPPGGGFQGGQGGGGVNFGSDYYFLSVLGEPSVTEPWMLQFGGHHLAVNATIVGSNITFSPTLTGGEPLKFTDDGRSIYIVEDEVNQSVAVLEGLNDEQREKMVISETRIDLVLGPGKDGMILQPEGLPASEMTEKQKAQFISLIEARLDMMNADDLAATMTQIKESIDQTYLAWYGPINEPGAAYFRITGPEVIIEFSPQGMDGDATNHAHNMYRDPTNEYGAAWTSAE